MLIFRCRSQRAAQSAVKAVIERHDRHLKRSARLVPVFVEVLIPDHIKRVEARVSEHMIHACGSHILAHISICSRREPVSSLGIFHKRIFKLDVDTLLQRLALFIDQPGFQDILLIHFADYTYHHLLFSREIRVGGSARGYRDRHR